MTTTKINPNKNYLVVINFSSRKEYEIAGSKLLEKIAQLCEKNEAEFLTKEQIEAAIDGDAIDFGTGSLMIETCND
jgi:isopentenyl diphosphate isomerase/L-lactate dehydrogenase-like FMN-dependent dehydrogenase